MAEGRLLKKKIVRSKKWRQLSDFEKWCYCILVSSVDSWGMMPSDPVALQATLGPFEERTTSHFSDAVKHMSDIDLLQTWDHQGDPWLYVIGHDEEQARGIRNRKPEPDVPRPPIPGEDPIRIHPGSEQDGSEIPLKEVKRKLKGKEVERCAQPDPFDAFWMAYPKKVGKGSARKVWKKLKVNDILLRDILNAVGRQKNSPDWAKDGGQFIPHPATWLNQERWSDSVEIEKPAIDQTPINPRNQWRDPVTGEIWNRINIEGAVKNNVIAGDLLDRVRKDRIEWDWRL